MFDGVEGCGAATCSAHIQSVRMKCEACSFIRLCSALSHSPGEVRTPRMARSTACPHQGSVALHLQMHASPSRVPVCATLSTHKHTTFFPPVATFDDAEGWDGPVCSTHSPCVRMGNETRNLIRWCSAPRHPPGEVRIRRMACSTAHPHCDTVALHLQMQKEKRVSCCAVQKGGRRNDLHLRDH